MKKNNNRLNKMVQNGWTPTRHGECLDCYNLRSMGGYFQPSSLGCPREICTMWLLSMEKYYEHTRPFLEVVGGVIRVRQSTIQGYAECVSGGTFDGSFASSHYRLARTINRGRVCNTLTSTSSQIYTFREYDSEDIPE